MGCVGRDVLLVRMNPWLHEVASEAVPRFALNEFSCFVALLTVEHY